MKIFVTGTDTNVGKTLICSWLCLQAGYDYFKPIQTGLCEGRDSEVIERLSGTRVFPEAFCYQAPVSPHLASALEDETIDMQSIQLPESNRLIIEGAGGVLVPVNTDTLMVDLIKHLNIPVILVASSRLGMINHSLLSIEAMKARNLDILGVIVSGEPNSSSCEAIEVYGKVPVLAQLPFLSAVNREELGKVALGRTLSTLLDID